MDKSHPQNVKVQHGCRSPTSRLFFILSHNDPCSCISVVWCGLWPQGVQSVCVCVGGGGGGVPTAHISYKCEYLFFLKRRLGPPPPPPYIHNKQIMSDVVCCSWIHSFIIVMILQTTYWCVDCIIPATCTSWKETFDHLKVSIDIGLLILDIGLLILDLKVSIDIGLLKVVSCYHQYLIWVKYAPPPP